MGRPRAVKGGGAAPQHWYSYTVLYIVQHDWSIAGVCRPAVLCEALCWDGAHHPQAGPHQEVLPVPQLCVQADCGEPAVVCPRHRRTERGQLPLRGPPALQLLQQDALLPVRPGQWEEFPEKGHVRFPIIKPDWGGRRFSSQMFQENGSHYQHCLKFTSVSRFPLVIYRKKPVNGCKNNFFQLFTEIFR